MNILDAINRYKELNVKNRTNHGLIQKENDEIYKLRKYIEENICEVLVNGYTLVYDKNDSI